MIPLWNGGKYHKGLYSMCAQSCCISQAHLSKVTLELWFSEYRYSLQLQGWCQTVCFGGKEKQWGWLKRTNSSLLSYHLPKNCLDSNINGFQIQKKPKNLGFSFSRFVFFYFYFFCLHDLLEALKKGSQQCSQITFLSPVMTIPQCKDLSVSFRANSLRFAQKYFIVMEGQFSVWSNIIREAFSSSETELNFAQPSFSSIFRAQLPVK